MSILRFLINCITIIYNLVHVQAMYNSLRISHYYLIKLMVLMKGTVTYADETGQTRTEKNPDII